MAEMRVVQGDVADVGVTVPDGVEVGGGSTSAADGEQPPTWRLLIVT